VFPWCGEVAIHSRHRRGVATAGVVCERFLDDRVRIGRFLLGLRSCLLAALGDVVEAFNLLILGLIFYRFFFLVFFVFFSDASMYRGFQTGFFVSSLLWVGRARTCTDIGRLGSPSLLILSLPACLCKGEGMVEVPVGLFDIFGNKPGIAVDHREVRVSCEPIGIEHPLLWGFVELCVACDRIRNDPNGYMILVLVDSRPCCTSLA
jgi:hypothetical protein